MGTSPLDLSKIGKSERRAILDYCSKTIVGFLSESEKTFYGAGVIFLIDGTWTILTAAHVVTAAKNCKDCCILFSNECSSDGKYPLTLRNYQEIISRVSNDRKGRKWDKTELDIGLIIPNPSVFEGLDNLIPINIFNSGNKNITSEIALISGFPKRLQVERENFGIVSNPIFTQFLPTPKDARKDDIALNWESIFQVQTQKLEKAPCAGGMSGGPIYFCIKEPIEGVWAPEKQIIFNGIIHWQYPSEKKDENCLLGHDIQVVKDFISILLNGWGKDDFRGALMKGYKPTGKS